MKLWFIVGSLLLATGCDRQADKQEEAVEDRREAAEERQEAAEERQEERQEERREAAEVRALAADDTGKNKRDRDDTALTPGDQGGSEADRKITQEVRQGVMKAEGLSITAQNVKIITNDGVVTLRGPVKSAAEKSQVAQIAQAASGVKKLDNQLEVAAE